MCIRDSNKLLRHLFGGLFDLGAGALPLGAAQLCKLHLFLVAGLGMYAGIQRLGGQGAIKD